MILLETISPGWRRLLPDARAEAMLRLEAGVGGGARRQGEICTMARQTMTHQLSPEKCADLYSFPKSSVEYPVEIFMTLIEHCHLSKYFLFSIMTQVHFRLRVWILHVCARKHTTKNLQIVHL
jgi:hypothetical protein